MPQVFLSHCSKDKQIVLAVRDYLRNSLINAWLDEAVMSGGDRILENVLPAINQSRYFILFVSNYYLKSAWCHEELSEALNANRTGKNIVIPVLLENRDQLNLDSPDTMNATMVKSLLERVKYIEYNSYNPESSQASIANSIRKNEPVQFEPVKIETIDNTRLQIVKFKISSNKNLPSDFLKNWDFNMLDFRSQSTGEKAVINPELPIAFSGRGPGWLYCYFSVPFKNLNDLFLYNSVTNDYICFYSKTNNLLGKVLKP